MSASPELDYETHFQFYSSIFGNDEEDVVRAYRKAQHDHSLVVFNALQDTSARITDISYYLKETQAQYYLRYGAGRRLLMMFYSYRHLIFTAYPERTDPMSEEEAQEIGKDVNLLYMHLRGTLDNLAWCLMYEKFPDRLVIDQMQVGLFTKAFKPMLEELGILDAVQEHADWNKDVKDRRDPVAHRIPLTVPPALLTPEEGNETRALQSEWSDLILKMAKQVQAGNLNDVEEMQTVIDSLRKRMNRLGKFLPFFVHHPDKPFIPIYPTLPTDMTHLIKVSRIVGKVIARADAPSL